LIAGGLLNMCMAQTFACQKKYGYRYLPYVFDFLKQEAYKTKIPTEHKNAKAVQSIEISRLIQKVGTIG
jgi:hypothetical protein